MNNLFAEKIYSAKKNVLNYYNPTLFKGKRVLITGGTKGLGLEMVLVFSSLGADVFWSYYSSNKTSADLVSALKESYPDQSFKDFSLDLASFSSIHNALNSDFIKDGIDILINNAGVSSKKPIFAFSDTEIVDEIQILLTGPIELSKHIATGMVKRKSGHIINISSIAAITGQKGLLPYSAAKAGIDGMTRALARELGPREIRVNGIAPGFISTELSESNVNEDHIDYMKSRGIIPREICKMDLAMTAVFLSCDLSRSITGQIIVLDNGAAIKY